MRDNIPFFIVATLILVIFLGLLGSCAPVSTVGTGVVEHVSSSADALISMKPIEFNYPDVNAVCFVQPNSHEMRCLLLK
jgi:hypothetical protein